MTKQNLNRAKFPEDISNLTPEELFQRYTVEEIIEMTEQIHLEVERLNLETARLKRENNELKEDIINGRKKLLQKYGSEPLVIAKPESYEDGTCQIALVIDGYLNLYPTTTSLYDTSEVVDLITHMLKIPEDRALLIGGLDEMERLHENAPDTPLTNLDIEWYVNTTMNWMTNKVEPKPERIRLGKQRFKLVKGNYKKMLF